MRHGDVWKGAGCSTAWWFTCHKAAVGCRCVSIPTSGREVVQKAALADTDLASALGEQNGIIHAACRIVLGCCSACEPEICRNADGMEADRAAAVGVSATNYARNMGEPCDIVKGIPRTASERVQLG